MSVIIVFPDGTDWFKANWVFRQLALDISERYKGDVEIREAIEAAQAVGALDLKTMNDGLRKRVMQALSVVATDTIKGNIVGWRPDERERAHIVLRGAFRTGEKPGRPKQYRGVVCLTAEKSQSRSKCLPGDFSFSPRTSSTRSAKP